MPCLPVPGKERKACYKRGKVPAQPVPFMFAQKCLGKHVGERYSRPVTGTATTRRERRVGGKEGSGIFLPNRRPSQQGVSRHAHHACHCLSTHCHCQCLSSPSSNQTNQPFAVMSRDVPVRLGYRIVSPPGEAGGGKVECLFCFVPRGNAQAEDRGPH